MWYVCGLRGVAALLAAVLVLTRPSWYSVFGVYLLADGLLCCASMLFAVGSGRLAFLVGAASSLIAGALALYSPMQRLKLEPMLLAAWAVILGLTTLGAGISLLPPDRQVLWCPLIGAGLVALMVAVLLLVPEVQRLVETRAILGLFAATFGYLQLRASFSLGVAGAAVAREPSDLLPSTRTR